MSSITCRNRGCKFLRGLFCGNDFVFLNQYGQCKVWFNNDGQFRGQPLYPSEAKPIDATEQPFPHPENNKDFKENKNETENAVSAKNSEKREDN